MHDKDDKIIYVGKAVSLRNRVRQYFRKNNRTKRIENMVSLIDHFEYIITDTEAEALILECNLIKKNRPKFNVLLKDDKTYPYIKINVRDEYPDIYITRRILNDGAKYFGPYVSAATAKEMIDFIKSKFRIRQCKNFKYKDRPCLNYHIKKCMGPCRGYISKEEYMQQVDEVIDLLEGRTDKVLKSLVKEMEQASDNMQYEKAAYLRDKKIAIERITEKQKVSNISENDIDVIGLARNDCQVCIEIFFVRKSKMIGREHYFLEHFSDETDSEILSNFIKQYYFGRAILPNKIMLKEEIEDKDAIKEYLAETSGSKVEIKTPQKGEKLRLVEMAENNAKITLENKEKDKMAVLIELRQVLGMCKLPRKIETYDISNISGQFMVAGMCVMQDGMIKKNLSRRFKIKTVFEQDDPKCMKEVITRRLRHSIDILNPSKTTGFGELPDAIFVDGGITQIKAAKDAISDINNEIREAEKALGVSETQKRVDIRVLGMVKDDHHTTRALINEGRKELPLSENLMNLITRFQDTVHNTAIEYYRKMHEKEMTKSALDSISGIGDIKKRELLQMFGSVEKIANAEVEEITKIKGISEELACKIKKELNNM